MALQHPAGGETGERQHQLHGVPPGHADHTPVRMVQVAAGDVVTQRRLPRGVEADRDVQLLQGLPQGLELGIVDVASVDRVRIADHGHRPQLTDGPSRLGDRGRDVLEGELRRELQPPGIVLAEVVGPGVVGVGEGGGHVGVQVVVHQDLTPPRSVEDRHVDAFDVHGLDVRRRIVAARMRDLVVRMTGEGAALEILADDRRARPLAHLADLDVADADDRLVGRVLRPAREPRRERLERRVEVLRPEVVRLHRVQVAVHHPESVLHLDLRRAVVGAW